MNSRGQAALEYLMTYGWALVIIVVVAGILFFIMSSPSSGVVCSSSDPTKMVVKSSNITAGTAAGTPVSTSVINLQNGTGGAIGSATVTAASGLFSATGEAISSQTCTTFLAAPCLADTAITQVIGGGNLYIYPKYASTVVSGSAVVSSTYTITYNDQFGYAKAVVLTCQGTIPTP
ncbi:MAG: hypothetical protein PHD95_02305 [Candidatus ainarchaeum sp.]|nr:hypothetical protein [Candidatus ainarchaeum sp.]